MSIGSYINHSRALTRLFWLVPLCLSAAGCGEYHKVRSQLDYLETSQQAIQTRLDSLSRKLDSVQGGKNLRALDSLNQIQLDLLYEARAENRNLYRLIDERLAVVERKQQEKLEQVIRQESLSRPDLRPTEDPIGTSESTVTLPDPKYVFDMAYRDLVQGHYDLAIAGFKEFLAQYPQNRLAPEVQYWIGEAYYAQKEYAVALEEFKNIITWYPHFEKMPVVLYKAGLCSTVLAGPDRADTYWQILQERFPQSPEAALAREKNAPPEDDEP